jgi:O-succinylbenzoic acid--CoA ligase
MLATSGSSGRPKLAQLSHRALRSAAHASAAHLGVDPAERWLACLPLAHVGGLSILTRMLFARRASVLFDAGGSLLAALPDLAAVLERHRITLLSLVPTLLERLLDAPEFRAKPPLRAILLGGAATSSALLKRAVQRGLPVLPTYGLTETAAQVCTRPFVVRGQLPVSDGPVAPSGVPVEGAEIRIVDGQIEVRGATLFSGYAEGITQVAPGGWFRTHDRGFIDGNGELVVIGRADDCIVTGGENVDPAEVESALSAIPGVRGACVFGMPDARFGEIVTAVIAREAPQADDAMKAALRERLSGYKIPRRITWVAALPLLASGKVDRAAARRLVREQPGDHALGRWVSPGH